MHEINIQLIEVELGESSYWLRFRGRIPTYDYNRLYSFSFCGTELEVKNAEIPHVALQLLREMIADDFGFGPYDLQSAKETLGYLKHYRILW